MSEFVEIKVPDLVN